MDNASARNMWGDYLDAHLEDAFAEAPKTIHFYDNEKDANESANLVKKGVKKVTSYSLLGMQCRNEALPQIGDFMVITNWKGKAQCVVRTTSVRFKPFFSIDESHAKLEGEGDKSLSNWKKRHWEYYIRELEPFNKVPRESMIVIFQTFEKVF
jgi:uncharacterized protein YhfF